MNNLSLRYGDFSPVIIIIWLDGFRPGFHFQPCVGLKANVIHCSILLPGWRAGTATVPSNLSSKFRLLYRAWHGIVVSLLLNDLFLLWVIWILDLNLGSNPAD